MDNRTSKDCSLSKILDRDLAVVSNVSTMNKGHTKTEALSGKNFSESIVPFPVSDKVGLSG